MQRNLILVLLALPLLAVVSHADMVTISHHGNTPVPVGNGTFATFTAQCSAVHEPQISMEREVVRITHANHGLQVSCTFEMKSHARTTLSRTVGFPVVHSTHSSMARTFRVAVDGTNADTALLEARRQTTGEAYGKADHRELDYPGFVTWEMNWKPGQTRTITCDYNMGTVTTRSTTLGYWTQLLYVVRTGAPWRGNIGEADISIAFHEGSRWRKPNANGKLPSDTTTALRVSYPKHATWIDELTIHWHFKDWNPTEDITIDALHWQGLRGDPRFELPTPYVGNAERYTEAMLDKLTKQELAPWKSAFPKRTAELEPAELRAQIAACLYHEIVARHGEAFVLGKVKPGQGAFGMGIGVGGMPPGFSIGTLPWKPGRPQVTGCTQQGHLTGKWNSYFTPHSLHGGWYRPVYDKKVQESDLNEVEQANRVFLKAFLPETERE